MEVAADVLRQSDAVLPDTRRKILYIQPGTHSFAGIERVVDTICSNITERYGDDFEVDVLYTTSHKNRPATRMYNVIDRRPRSRLELMQTFRDVIRSKDYSLVVVPQIEPAVIAMASCIGLRRNFAVHLHGNPHRERSHMKARVLFFLMKAFFSGAPLAYSGRRRDSSDRSSQCFPARPRFIGFQIRFANSKASTTTSLAGKMVM